MDDLERYINKSLQDSEFKKAYDSKRLKYDLISKMISLREEEHITQLELAERIGTTQAVISRLENGSTNLTLSMMARIAEAFNRKLRVEFA
ncbi:transcriptional regulator [Campylobacterota bacterium]|nr:transcriptional regulator [Campylobacterota bacterium]